MSRRKQAKPRALKREEASVPVDGEDEDEEEGEEEEEEEDEDEDDEEDATSETGGAGRHHHHHHHHHHHQRQHHHQSSHHQSSSDKYRCETCGVSLDSVRSFMDHRNFDCVAGMEETHRQHQHPAADVTSSSSRVGVVAMEAENSLESDLNGTDTWRSDDTPDNESLSPSSCATPTTDPEVESSGTVGVTESTPYACQFCERAFPRLSYLKRHEQSHGDQMPFRCDFCQRLFKHKRSRDRHVKLHTGDKKYRCPHCEAAFSRSDHLKIHMKTHDNAKPFQCTTCNRGYNTAAALTSHMQTHILGHSSDSLEKMTQCVFCSQVCVGFDALATHMDAAHPGEKPSKCPICGDPTTSMEQLCQHMKVHEELALSVAMDESHPAPNKGRSSPTKLACIYCTKDNFASEEALQLHVNAMHGTSSLLNGELQHQGQLSPGSLAVALLPFSPSANNSHQQHFNCEYCTMKFGSVQALQKHTLSVHSFTDVLAKGKKEMVFCSQCTMGFTSSGALTEHVKLVHGLSRSLDGGIGGSSVGSCSSNTSDGGVVSPKLSPSHPKDSKRHHIKQVEPIKVEPKVNGDQFTHPGTLLCNQCNAAFPDFESFRTHLKTHLDEVIHKFVCSECQGEFSSEEQLDGHVVTHYLSTTTEYGCQCCLKLFSKPDELQKHLMDIHAHHLYRCSLCKEMFDSKVSIQVHFAVKHSNECKLFKCTACNSVFRSEMEFQLHVKVAHLRQAKPFRCLFCSLGFGSELELQCHLMAHKKQFACTLCDEAFHVEFLLDKHMQTKHSETSVDIPEVQQPLSTASVSLTTTAVVSTTSSEVSSIPSSSKIKSKSSSSVAPSSSSTSSVAASSIKKGELKCDICDAELPSESTLTQHRKQVHNIKASSGASTSSGKGSQQTLSLCCAYCNEACKSRTELENHMKVHTLSSSKHKCNVCDEVCPTASILAEHKLTHCKVVSGSMCVACKVGLKSEDQYYSHLQQHNAQGLPLPCVICRQTLMSEVEVQVHAKFHLKNAEPLFPCCLCLKQLELNNLVSNGTSTGVQTYMCKECFHQSASGSRSVLLEGELRCVECKVKFETEMDLEKHVRVHHKKTYQCIKCQMSFETEKEIQLHVASHLLHEGSHHECHLCHKVLDSPAKLQCHLIEHTFEGCASYTCYMCSAVFTTANLIQQHMLEHGLNSRPYDCTHCHQKFFFRAELENHVFSHAVDLALLEVESVQGAGGVLQCPECLRTFSSPLNLANHRKVHQQKSSVNYKCSSCTDVFETSVDMQQHYFKVHGNSSSSSSSNSSGGESNSNGKGCDSSSSPQNKQPFRCSECDQEFPCLSNLQGHMRLHTPGGTKFTCPECSKEFALSRNLHIHMRLHSGEKPYECPMCDKRFARKENRKAHLKAHTGLRPFLCPHCGKAFSRKCHVKEHMRLHNNNQQQGNNNNNQSELCPEEPTVNNHHHHHHRCKVCEKRFPLLKSLKRHMRKMHRATAEVSKDGLCSGEAMESECSSQMESESSRTADSPFEERNNVQELMVCE